MEGRKIHQSFMGSKKRLFIIIKLPDASSLLILGIIICFNFISFYSGVSAIYIEREGRNFIIGVWGGGSFYAYLGNSLMLPISLSSVSSSASASSVFLYWNPDNFHWARWTKNYCRFSGSRKHLRTLQKFLGTLFFLTRFSFISFS